MSYYPTETHREPLQVKISSSRDLADFGSMEVIPSLTRFWLPWEHLFLLPQASRQWDGPISILFSLIKAATKQTIKSGRHLVGRQKDPEKPRVAQEAYLQRSQWVNYFWHAGAFAHWRHGAERFNSVHDNVTRRRIGWDQLKSTVV